MRSHGLRIDHYTLPPVLRSCTIVGSTNAVGAVHGLASESGLDRDHFVASAFVVSYVGLSSTRAARKLFDEIPERDYVLWTSMVSGHAQSGEPEAALEMFMEMLRCGVKFDDVVIVSLLLACSQLGSLRLGRCVHGVCVRRQFGLPLTLGNAIVDMYVKCGALHFADRVFRRMPTRDVISWSSLILGHGLNGSADVSLELFEEMEKEGVAPNSVTFLGVISACAHSAMVERALDLFHAMKQYNVEPELKHYTCVVDALARAGRLVEAEDLVVKMHVEPDEAILGALLLGCRIHGNFGVGERVAGRLIAMQPDQSGHYVGLANMYTNAGRFQDAHTVRSFMRDINVGKLPSWSSIEL